jgi:hypothetical protein
MLLTPGARRGPYTIESGGRSALTEGILIETPHTLAVSMGPRGSL